MTDADVIAAIRQTHLRANIAGVEGRDGWTVYWERATVDGGGSLFGSGPYLHVPASFVCLDGVRDDVVIRVYAPARLRRRLARAWTGSTTAAGRE